MNHFPFILILAKAGSGWLPYHKRVNSDSVVPTQTNNAGLQLDIDGVALAAKLCHAEGVLTEQGTVKNNLIC